MSYETNGIEYADSIEYGSIRSACTKSMVADIIETGKKEKRFIESIQREFVDSIITGEYDKRGKTERHIITMYRNPDNGKYFISDNGKVIHAADTRDKCAELAYKAGHIDESTRIKFGKGDAEYQRHIARNRVRSALARK